MEKTMGTRSPLAAFDLDGTLHWTEKALVPAIGRAMRELGVEPAQPALINSLYGEPLEEFCRVLLGSASEGRCRRFMRAIGRHQRDTLPVSGSLYPGVARMLRLLQESGVSMAVISNAGEDYISLVLDTLGIAELFDVLMGVEGGVPKSGRLRTLLDSELYGNSVMVGDRYHDLQAAARNGVPFIGCAYGYGSGEEIEAADAVVSEAREIPAAMVRLGIMEARTSPPRRTGPRV